MPLQTCPLNGVRATVHAAQEMEAHATAPVECVTLQAAP